MTRIVVVGGYGVFGGRITERLARDPELTVIVAGRNLASARSKRDALAATAKATIEATALDVLAIDADALRRLGARIVINAVGPYQRHDYRVAQAAIGAGAHYIDLADARAFVTGIGALDAEAQAAGVLVTSGASSVPALAAAVIDGLAPRFGAMETLTYAISPGNSFDPGEATVASILGAVGKPFTVLRDGAMATAHGWQPLVTHRGGDTGTRWLGACDVPDLDLFPVRYPTLKTQHFLAGVEVRLFHGGLWLLSWLVRGGLVRSLEPLARPLLAAKRRLGFLGSDRGLMFIRIEGREASGRPLTVTWSLVAHQGHGPYIPGIPAVIIARRLAAGEETRRGALPCLGLMSHGDFDREVSDLDIRQTLA